MQSTLAKGLFHLPRDCLFVEATCTWLCSPRRYLNEPKITLPPGQHRAYLACALLFVPPMIPRCDVRAAVQHRAKRKPWPHCISSPDRRLFLGHPKCSVWQSCAFHAWVTWLNGGNPTLFPNALQNKPSAQAS